VEGSAAEKGRGGADEGADMRERMIGKPVGGIDLLALALVVCFVAGGATVFEAPDGVGGAKFGMSAEQVRELFPAAELDQDTGEADSGSSELPRFVDLRVDGQEVLGMVDCKLRFRFASDQLYMIGCGCPLDEKSVREVLEKEFGEPNYSWGQVVYWRGERYGVSLRSGVIGFYDRQLDSAVQRALRAAMEKEKAQRRSGGEAGTGP
jgi:hypothetical protein